MLNNEDKIWLDKTLEKVITKWERIASDVKDAIPSTVVDGICDDKSLDKEWNDDDGIYWWTNGFYPGILWILYLETKDEFYKTLAEKIEKKLDAAFLGFEGLHHDVGFMWLTSAVANFKITGNSQSKKRGLLAASILASRFNHKGGYIRAWNGDKTGWAIIDCMLNINILYWASEQLNDERFSDIARMHADKTLKYFVRPDGSVKHIVSFDPETGEEIENFGGQGFEVGSSWSRGQSWALYGFILSYIHTNDEKYLSAAKRIAHYFISCVQDDYIPNCDFRAPSEPVIKDTSAGAIAACALIEISKHTSEFERDLYLTSAIKILKSLTEHCTDFSHGTHELLKNGTGSYHGKDSHHIPLIYGDYFYLEGLFKLKNNEILFW